jgi:ring-1,2-phenylacetyl-CoA epoxidase subunit PaaE
VLLTLPIREVVPATPRSRVLRIDLLGDRFPYQPGQAVLLAAHGHEKRRPYSLAAAPEDAERNNCLELLIGTNMQGVAGPHLALHPGALVDVEGPLGRFTFPEMPEEVRFVFVAGGSGIAPLRAMLQRALHVPHQRIGVLYSARTLRDFAYEDELRQLAGDGLIELKQTVTREIEGHEWQGIRGRIGLAELAPLVHDPATLCFICGPPALVHDMPKLLGELGVPRARIRIEEWE